MRLGSGVPRLIALFLLLVASATAMPLRLLVIGDSLSEEYEYEAIFSAPASAPLSANTNNWVELLSDYRFDEVTLGTYAGSLGSYEDWRDAGYRLNFGVPSFTTVDWLRVFFTTDQPNPLDFGADTAGYLRALADYRTRNALITEVIANTDVAVIFLGGNDLKNDYNELFNDIEPADFYTRLRGRIDYFVTQLRQWKPGLPVIVATMPDVGATPNIYETYTTPAKQLSTRAKIAGYNADLAGFFPAKPDTAVARIDAITDLAFDLDPFQLNGTVFTLEGDPENPPDHLFTRDDFHPATVAQGLVANEVIAAVNELFPDTVTPFTKRELLAIAGLDPDQPYLDWIDGFPVSADGMDEDPDQDRLPNLVELGLGTAPDQFSPVAGSWEPGGALSWTPNESASDYLELFAEESTTLGAWSPVPPERTMLAPDGSVTVTPPEVPAAWFRLRAAPR